MVNGTDWYVQEMVWNIMHGVDLESAKATSLEKRVGIPIYHFVVFLFQVPFLELSGLLEGQFIADGFHWCLASCISVINYGPVT